ncbi:MerR family transcriptional regulator [Dictyobacter aurantiacus]|uniref:Putative transcriptional regulator, MerR family protein n=1 Tax=Dictyobacter aurantiacus TaxID=1936993 RepID=A0A401ZKT5_9CHLR|nr:MerR family transcriptional regulator [Dictyobacter aurantiacus]GCE07487.1 putative transcriptional regulator, MerR family protein [Dictyobacter aurantiacus]
MTSLQQQETYTIHEVAQRSGLSIPTLRYYEEIGLVPAVQRDASSGHRRYSADTLQIIESLANLRAVGMSIEEMRAYLALRERGDETAVEKRELFRAHAEEVEKQIARLRIRQRYLTFKVTYWDARARGDIDEAERIAQEYESIVKDLR